MTLKMSKQPLPCSQTAILVEEHQKWIHACIATNPVYLLKTSTGSGTVALGASTAESSTWQSLILYQKEKNQRDGIRAI